MFAMLAQQLTDAGFDMKRTLKPDVDIPWTKQTVKEYLWKPIMVALLNKESTTQLTTKEVDQVFSVLNRHLGDKLGIVLEFPSIETIINKQRFNNGAKTT